MNTSRMKNHRLERQRETTTHRAERQTMATASCNLQASIDFTDGSRKNHPTNKHAENDDQASSNIQPPTSSFRSDLTYQAHRTQLLLASHPTTTPPHTSPLITMCSKRVSPYHECPYSHKEVTDEKFCFRDGVIVPCVNWEWLIIKELPTPGPCPCADCQAWKRRQNMQNGTAGSRSNDISQ